MEYYVFDLEQTAIDAEAWISQTGGAPITPVRVDTQEPDPDAQKTLRWAEPEQRLDGKWVFQVVPDALASQFDQATIDYFNGTFPHVREEYQPSWFVEDGE